MTRTTVDLDPIVLDQIKAQALREHKSMGAVISDLVQQALSPERDGDPRAEFEWFSKPMYALIDLEDKDAVFDALETYP